MHQSHYIIIITSVLLPSHKCFFVNDFDSIAATIQFHRPDLPIPAIGSANTLDMIPLNPPFNFFAGMHNE